MVFDLLLPPCLQVVNLRPTQPVEAHLIFSNAEQRFPGTALDDVLDVVQQHLPVLEVIEAGDVEGEDFLQHESN